MIPDFKTYINESVWGDLRKKSLGQERRIENDVDNMDPAEFYEYVDSHYKGLTKETKISAWGQNLNFSLLVLQYENSSSKSFIHVQEMESSQKGRIVRITNNIDNKTTLFNKLKKNFTVERGWGSYEIYPFEAMSVNRLFLNVVDFLLENADFSFTKCIKEVVNESVWGDLRKKSLGQEKRIEDDIDFMDPITFCDYIKNTYKLVSTQGLKIFVYGKTEINVPIFEYDLGTKSTDIIYYDSENKRVFSHDTFVYHDDKLLEKLEKTYKVKNFKMGLGDYMSISPKDGSEPTNTFFLEVIDYLLKNANVFYHRILIPNDDVNESVWGDIRKKSLGQEDRLEDDVNVIEPDKFVDYISDKYRMILTFLQPHYISLTNTISIPVFASQNPTPDNPKHKKYMYFFYDCDESDRCIYITEDADIDFLNTLKKNYKYRKYAGTYWAFTPKDGSKADNKFCIEIIDFTLKYIKDLNDNSFEPLLGKKGINESVWGDMRKKSLGQEIREEENVDLLDLEGFYEYLKSHYDFDFKEWDIMMFNDKSGRYDGHIRIPLGQKFQRNNCVFYSANKHLMYIHHYTFPKYFPDLYKKLQDNFQVTKKSNNDLYIWIEDFAEDEGSNTFCLKVLDFMIDNIDEDGQPLIFKKEMNESVWGDIRKKSLGQEERLEFDVNQLNCEELLEYLRKHYSFRNVGRYTYDQHLSGNENFVFIPFAVLNTNMQCYGVTYSPNYWGGDESNNVIKISIDFFKCTHLKHLYRQMKTVFRCEKNDLFSIIYIYPKDKNRKVDIKFFLEFLDYCATELVFEYPAICVIKQDEKMNESVWGDIRKKSLGQEKRLEDDVNSFQCQEFMEYLNKYYKIADPEIKQFLYLVNNTISFFVMRVKPGVTTFIDLANPGTDNAKIYISASLVKDDEQQMDMDLRNKLVDNFIVKKANSEEYKVYPKNGGNVTNRFFIEFINFILDNASDVIYKKIVERR